MALSIESNIHCIYANLHANALKFAMAATGVAFPNPIDTTPAVGWKFDKEMLASAETL
jgi:hypothetical protein